MLMPLRGQHRFRKFWRCSSDNDATAFSQRRKLSAARQTEGRTDHEEDGRPAKLTRRADTVIGRPPQPTSAIGRSGVVGLTPTFSSREEQMLIASTGTRRRYPRDCSGGENVGLQGSRTGRNVGHFRSKPRRKYSYLPQVIEKIRHFGAGEALTISFIIAH